MQMILKILRAAHCRSTHHYFALDALKQLKTPPAQRLGLLLLKYHDEYLDGAKAPDTRFRDFHNHVIHIGENNWGGAAQKCQEWRDTVLGYFNKAQWKKAAYACGVLSHYFTDPIMPLHTAQSPDESAVHRPVEWSVFKAYHSIYQLAQQRLTSAQFQFANDEKWIHKASLAVAQISHQNYSPIIQNYDLAKAAREPDFGLNSQLQEIFATQFALAIDGWAAVLSRLADEITVELPSVSLGLPSVLALVDMPLAWLIRRFSDFSERRAVVATVKEYQRTGSVAKHLAQEVRAVRRAKEAGAQIAIANSAELPKPIEVRNPSNVNEKVVGESAKALATDETSTHVAQNSGRLSGIVLTNHTPLPEAQSDAIAEGRQLHSFDEFETDFDPPIFLSLAEARARMKGVVSQVPSDASPSQSDAKQLQQDAAQSQSYQGLSPQTTTDFPSATAIEKEDILPTVQGKSTLHDYCPVSPGSSLIEAPSIGPKTAKRFEKIGIRTIGQFINENPDELESKLATRWITATLIADWQDQTRLVCEVPALSGYRAQLLVAVGCRTAWQLRTSSATTLGAQLAQFCQTSEGQQILHAAQAPSNEDVAAWIESARAHARRKAA